MGIKKVVNGKIVNIDNIELFEKAFKNIKLGLIKEKNKDKIEYILGILEVLGGRVREVIEEYIKFYSSLPFPFNSLNDGMIYSIIKAYLIEVGYNDFNYYVFEGCIYINKDDIWVRCSGFDIIIEKCLNIEKAIKLEDFVNDKWYSHYIWLLNSYREGKSLTGYYKEFMSEFYNACNGDVKVLKWELINIMNFGYKVNRLELKENVIIDIDNDIEYIIDIYFNKYIELEEEEMCINLYSNTASYRKKRVKTYKYDVYEKSYEENEGSLVKVEVDGMHNLFLRLVGVKESNLYKKIPTYKGFIVGGNLIYTVEDNVFICKAYKQSKEKMIASKCKIYGYDKSMLYLLKSTREDNIYKDTIYSYNIHTGDIRIVDVDYRHINIKINI
ncbi:MAG: hypothetical protein QXD03_02470 [Candidatus Anstonellales archaeon]